MHLNIRDTIESLNPRGDLKVLLDEIDDFPLDMDINRTNSKEIHLFFSVPFIAKWHIAFDSENHLYLRSEVNDLETPYGSSKEMLSTISSYLAVYFKQVDNIKSMIESEAIHLKERKKLL